MNMTVEERLRKYTTQLDQAVEDYAPASPRDVLEPTHVRAGGRRYRRAQLVGAAAVVVGIALVGAWWVRGSNNGVVISTNSTTATRPPAGVSVTVPNVIGLDRTSLMTRLDALGLRAAVVKQYSETVPAGQVWFQEPEAGSTVRSGSVVRVLESSGPDSNTRSQSAFPPKPGMTVLADGFGPVGYVETDLLEPKTPAAQSAVTARTLFPVTDADGKLVGEYAFALGFIPLEVTSVPGFNVEDYRAQRYGGCEPQIGNGIGEKYPLCRVQRDPTKP